MDSRSNRGRLVCSRCSELVAAGQMDYHLTVCEFDRCEKCRQFFHYSNIDAHFRGCKANPAMRRQPPQAPAPAQFQSFAPSTMSSGFGVPQQTAPFTPRAPLPPQNYQQSMTYQSQGPMVQSNFRPGNFAMQVPAPQTTTRQIGPNTFQTETVEYSPNGSVTRRVETRGPGVNHVSVSTTGGNGGFQVVQTSGNPGVMVNMQDMQMDFGQNFPFGPNNSPFGPGFPFGGLNFAMFLGPLLAALGGQQQRRMTREDIARLKRIRFAKPPAPEGEEEKCTICISELEEREEVVQLTCGHLFHPVCVENWLLRSATCPVCKIEL